MLFDVIIEELVNEYLREMVAENTSCKIINKKFKKHAPLIDIIA